MLWLIDTARDLDRDRDWEMMGFYIMPCTVHTTQGWNRESLFPIVPIPFSFLVPVPVPCNVYKPLVALTERGTSANYY